MRDLVALETGGPAFVDSMLHLWDARDAVLPVDSRLPKAAAERLFAVMRPSAVVDADGNRSRIADGVPVCDGDALVMATSGSTGEPKGVIHTHEAVGASARATNAGLGADPATDRWLCCLPLSHVAGLSVVTRALLSGTSLQVLDGFDAHAVTAAALNGATLTSLVPTALARVDPQRFRRIVVGGAHPPKIVPPNCVVSYGLTETGSAIAYDGVPLQGAEIRLREGHVEVKGPMLFRAYRDGTPEGRDPMDVDGWFDTGDVGEWDAQGRLVVHGRSGDLIITGGENVWPVEVERELETHMLVQDAVVAGEPDDEWGQIVVAYVVPTDPRQPPDLEGLRSYVKETLPAFAAPRRLVIVDDLPKTPLGKVLRHGPVAS